MKRTVDANVDEAQRAIDALERRGISMSDVTDKLLVDGLASFQKSFDTLIAGLEKKTKALGKELADESIETRRVRARIHQPPSHVALLPNEDRLHARAVQLVARDAAQPHGGGAQRRPHQLLARHARAARRDDRAGPRRRRTSCGRPVAILGDLQGPRIRIGDLPAPRDARRRQRRRARARAAREQGDEIPVTYDRLADDVHVGDRILDQRRADRARRARRRRSRA